MFQVPWLRLASDSTLAPDSARIWHDTFLRERFFNADASAMLVLMLCEPDLSKAKSDSLLAQRRSGARGERASATCARRGAFMASSTTSP